MQSFYRDFFIDCDTVSIWRGGFTEAALRRAVRYGDGFSVPDANREVYDSYIAELMKENRPTDNVRFASGFFG